MLHLDPRVHFEGVIVPLVIEEKLHRPSRDVTDLPHRPGNHVSDFLPLPSSQVGARRFFDELLVMALYRALPLAQVYGIVLGIDEKLKFDVPPSQDELFRIDPVVTEALLRHGPCPFAGIFYFLLGQNLPHPLAASSRCGFYNDGVADFLPEILHILCGSHIFDGGYHGNPRCHEGTPGLDLVSQHAHNRGGGADKDQAGLLTCFHEIRVFRQETVSGEDRLAARVLCGPYNGIDIKVTHVRRGRAEANTLIGQPHVK